MYIFILIKFIKFITYGCVCVCVRKFNEYVNKYEINIF